MPRHRLEDKSTSPTIYTAAKLYKLLDNGLSADQPNRWRQPKLDCEAMIPATAFDTKLYTTLATALGTALEMCSDKRSK